MTQFVPALPSQLNDIVIKYQVTIVYVLVKVAKQRGKA